VAGQPELELREIASHFTLQKPIISYKILNLRQE